ncbi:MAG TPA: glycosyltransferase family 2 protein [Chitinophagales bacterium]|nr:glycosyltransferase family 2 protein [Chitinophagales bacterium]HQO89325.1 glycosyltransferase family 2 protein [Chitinophagales bacterium]
MKKIGLVTITYNSAKVITPFMDCVLRQTHTDFILYIIDNISSDNTLELLSKYKDDRIVIIANTQNVGVAAGNNQGIVRAMADGCDEILIINNDVEFEYTLLEKLSRQLEELNCSLVAPKMMYHPETHLIWWAGTKFNPKEGCMTHHIGIQEEDKGQYDHIEKMDYAPTCCVLLKREVIDDIGLMDEKYFAYYDDTDFFYRIFKQGKHVLFYYPFVQFYHKVGGLSNMKKGNAKKFKFNNFYIHLITRNHVYYLRKQKSLRAWWNIIYFFFRMNLRFIFSGKYHLNFATFRLLQSSFWEGLKM